MATAAELLAETEAAISACLTAQSYTIAGRAKNMAALSSLREFRRELMEEIDSGSDGSGSMCSLGIQLEPSL